MQSCVIPGKEVNKRSFNRPFHKRNRKEQGTVSQYPIAHIRRP